MIKCTLDEDNCIDLRSILRIINQINQEQAWAICYELASLMKHLTSTNKNSCAPIESLEQIKLHKDGYVHPKTCSIITTNNIINNNQKSTAPTTNDDDNRQENDEESENKQQTKTITTPNNKSAQTIPPTPPITPELNELLRRRPAINEQELVASLGIALFSALDYGIADDEERKLSLAMEYLIYQSQTDLSLNEILKLCINRLTNQTKLFADQHYKDVCRNIIKDTIELSIFLEKIYTASMVLRDTISFDDCLDTNQNHRHYNNNNNNHINNQRHHVRDISDEDLDELGEPLASLRALRINDWARLWMQVIRELRQRGRTFTNQTKSTSSSTNTTNSPTPSSNSTPASPSSSSALSVN